MVSDSKNNTLSQMMKVYLAQEIAKTREIKCEKCGSYERLEFHHLKYSPKHNVTPNDIQVLCATCHRNIKNHNKRSGSKTETIFKDGKRYCFVGTYFFEY